MKVYLYLTTSEAYEGRGDPLRGPTAKEDTPPAGGVGQASRASIIAESAQRSQYVFPLTRFAAWYRVSADFANLSKFSSCS